MKDAERQPTRLAGGLLSASRLARYAVTGCLSAATHLGTLTVLVESGAAPPVTASTVGFVLSIVVSYTLQKSWVFASTARHRTTLPRFLVATLVAMLLNAAVVGLGTEVFSLHYLAVQAVALVLIPVSNYVINALWTFGREHR